MFFLKLSLLDKVAFLRKLLGLFWHR